MSNVTPTGESILTTAVDKIISVAKLRNVNLPSEIKNPIISL
jgi:hypothetical protein